MKESRAMESANRVVMEWARWTRSGTVTAASDSGSAAADAAEFVVLPDSPQNIPAEGAGGCDESNAGGAETSGEAEKPETEVWRNVRWVQQGKRDHWLIYDGKDDPLNSDKLSNEIKTVLHVKDNVLTWIRRGAAEWRHQFEEGHQFTSRLHTGPLVLDVKTHTHSLSISVDSDGGNMRMDYSLDVSGELQRVQTQIRFFKEGLYAQQEGPEGLE